MNPKKISCLPDCPDRSPECHATCRRNKLREAANEILRKKRQAEREATTYAAAVRYLKASEEKHSRLVQKGSRRRWNTRQNTKGVK